MWGGRVGDLSKDPERNRLALLIDAADKFNKAYESGKDDMFVNYSWGMNLEKQMDDTTGPYVETLYRLV